MVHRFSQPVWDLGYTETKDVALLYRALEAYALHMLAARAASNLEQLSSEEAGLLIPLQKALRKLEH